jgi:hypothetical protein
MLKRKKHQDEKEEGFLQKVVEKVKEISFYSYMLSFLIAVLLVICFRIYLDAQKDKKNSAIKKTQTVVQTQIVPKEQFVKKDVYLNETAKLNSNNYEFFISEKDSNRGILLIKASDFIKNNTKIILYNDVKNVIISGNPEILKKLNVSISTSNKMNFNTESINIELDHNQKNNSILSVELNTDLLDKEQIINDSTLIQVRYIENAD